MALSTKKINQALDVLDEFTERDRDKTIILSCLETDAECDFMLKIVKEKKLKHPSDVLYVALKICEERDNANGKKNYLKNVKL